MVLYTGTFEAYQGLDLLFEAAASAAGVASRRPRAGRGRQRRPGRGGAAPAPSRSAPATVVFTGQQPAREIPAFVAAAAVLASPRIRGTNTPLKIYSYLRSGVPIVATNLLTHTQVLAPRGGPARRRPRPDAFAAAIGGLLDDPSARPRVGRGGPPSVGREVQPRGLPGTHRRGRPPPQRARRRYVSRNRGRGALETVTVLVTGATGFTGGHLARHAGPPRARGAGARPRARASSGFAPRTRPPPARWRSRAISQHPGRARRRVPWRRGGVPHRRDLSGGGPARLRLPRWSTSTAP